uniref:AB hydrolase-1 domain-containing protein n=1 Tax=Odontella aurita TaxID=265563 RepID=A0A7S4HQL9_9STRA
MGDPSTHPAMVFFHGWPDTSATWANYFAEFCGEDKRYFCVAPSLINFHPDLEPADDSELTFKNQRAQFLAVIKELDLSDITLVMFDFGAFIGYGFLYEHSELISRVVAMDIAMNLQPPDVPNEGAIDIVNTYPDTIYQTNNVKAFNREDDEFMDNNIRSVVTGLTQRDKVPCVDCKIAPNATKGVGWRTGWPYYELFARYEPGPWTDGFNVSVDLWEFGGAPSFPSNIPFLYLYSKTFVSEDWNNWIDQRGDGSKQVLVVSSVEHWFPIENPEETIVSMKEWLDDSSSSAMLVTWFLPMLSAAMWFLLLFV